MPFTSHPSHTFWHAFLNLGLLPSYKSNFIETHLFSMWKIESGVNNYCVISKNGVSGFFWRAGARQKNPDH